MSQEYTTTSRRTRRTARGQRNKPVLVTETTENEQGSTDVQNDQETAAETATQVMEPTPVSALKRRLPGFFSTVGKKDGESGDRGLAVAQARIARATHGKKPAKEEKTAAPAAEETKAAKPAASRPAPARPASPFKRRYILGIVIYIAAAQLLGPVIQSLLRSIGAERELTRFFGIPVTTSILLFLSSLVVILIVLARFDLLPRGFNAASSSKSSSTRSSSNRAQGEGERRIPPTIRQGVQGESDELYQQYRVKQRREKKR